jgi:hypothetical protein
MGAYGCMGLVGAQFPWHTRAVPAVQDGPIPAVSVADPRGPRRELIARKGLYAYTYTHIHTHTHTHTHTYTHTNPYTYTYTH